MKIRNGFVSNSSTSSFLIWGCIAEDKNIPKELFDQYDSRFELMDEIRSKTSSELSYWLPPTESIYLGVPWSRVKDDETGRQFKDRVEKLIKDFYETHGFIDEPKFGTHQEAWND